jgi:predicted GNAT family N-acyltransferase
MLSFIGNQLKPWKEIDDKSLDNNESHVMLDKNKEGVS